MNPAELANTMWALARLGLAGEPAAPLLEAAASEATRRAVSLAPRYAATMAWAVARLGGLRGVGKAAAAAPGTRAAVGALATLASALEAAAAPLSGDPPSIADYAMALPALADARVRPASLPESADAAVAAALREGGGFKAASASEVAAVLYGCVSLTGRATQLEVALADAVGGGGRRGGRVAGRAAQLLPGGHGRAGIEGPRTSGVPPPATPTPAAASFAAAAGPTGRARAVWALAVLGDWGSPLYAALAAGPGPCVGADAAEGRVAARSLALIASAAALASAARAAPPLTLPVRVRKEVKRRLYADGGAGPGPRGAPARSAAAALASLPGVEPVPPRRLPGLGLDIPIAAHVPGGGLVALEVLSASDLTRGPVRGPAGPARARRATLGALGYRVVALDGPRWASAAQAQGDSAPGAGEVLAALLGPELLSGGGVGEGDEEWAGFLGERD
jgi:hypothetical protein